MQIFKAKTKPKLISPQTLTNGTSYSKASIQRVNQGCYDKNKKLMIDSGFGDYSMSLFRLKDKHRYIRQIPSAFTPKLKQLIIFRSNVQKTNKVHDEKMDNQQQDRIYTQHNEQIQRILNEPKESIIEKIRRQRQKRQQQQRIRNQYVKGQDKQVRQYQEQLSFNYLPAYQAQKWFKIRDNISVSLPPLKKMQQIQLSTHINHSKVTTNKKKKGFIFLSDQKINNISLKITKK